jgi:hypothetical protein
MAVTNTVYIAGDSSSLRLEAKNLTTDDPLEFISGTFRSTPEERRVCVVFFNFLGQTFELRFEFTSPEFVEHSITGKAVTQTQDTL